MMRLLCLAAFFAAFTAFAATPAVAVTSTTVIITDNGQPVPSTSVHLFDTATGTEVQQEDEDDDKGGAIFLLPGGNYRIEVGGKPVKEITVTGEGSETVTAELAAGGSAGEMLFGPGGPALHVAVEGAFLWRGGDDFEGGPGGDSSDFAQPDSGLGARATLGLDYGALLARASVNGAWTNDGTRTPAGMGLDFDQDAELDAFWATLELFYQLAYGEEPGRSYPATLFGIGGGLEFADLEHSFTEKLVTPLGNNLTEMKQETTSWGVGPRVSAFGKHAIRGTNFWITGEVGAGLLFGSKDSELRDDAFGSVFEERDEESERILHLGARLAIAYDFLYGSTPFTLYAGVQYDRFTNSINQHFLPDRQPGDNALYGPFAGIGAKF